MPFLNKYVQVMGKKTPFVEMDNVQNTVYETRLSRNSIPTTTACGTALSENGFNVFPEVNVKKTVDHGVNGVVDKVRLGAKFVGHLGLGTEVFLEVLYNASHHHHNEERQKTDDVSNRHGKQHDGCPGNAHAVPGRPLAERLFRVTGRSLVVVAILFRRHFRADWISGNLV